MLYSDTRYTSQMLGMADKIQYHTILPKYLYLYCDNIVGMTLLSQNIN